MSNLEKLLEGVEVEWKTLGEIGEVCMCKRILKEQTSDTGDIPFYKIGTFGKEPNAYISKKLFDEYKSKYSYPKIGEVLISASGTIGRAVIFDGKDAYFQDSNIVWIKNDESQVLNKYLFYFYQIAKWGVSEGGTIQRLYNDNLKKTTILIPSPDDPKKSLEIQKEIVRILDEFSMLTAMLTAMLTVELQGRKSQYEYYRNQLLAYPMEESDQPSLRSSRSATSIQNSDNSMQPLSALNPHIGNSVLQPRGKVEWKMLGEIAEYSHKRINAATMRKTNYVGVDNLLQNKAGKIESNYVPTEGNLTAYTVGDILIGNIRPYLKKIWLADNNGGTNGDVLVIHLTDQSVDMRYLYQVLADDNFFVYNMQHAKGAKMPRGNKQKIMEYSIPIPPIEEQKHIVSILDKFDTLINSITEGLPKEIELRQKQYEYYRDMLLSFPKNNIKA